MSRVDFSKKRIVIRDRNASPLRKIEADKQRFWRAVEQSSDGCWMWCATPGKGGYGSLWSCYFHRTFAAHRFAWFIYYGELPTKHVLHKCDTPGCVRRDHLFLGTNEDNMRDMIAKGRQATKNPKNRYSWRGIHAKLTPIQVMDIFARRRAGERTVALAREFGVGRNTISAITNGRRYGYITGEAETRRREHAAEAV